MKKTTTKKTTESVAQSRNYFEGLANVDVSKKIEKKGNLSYLSWAYAWAELKKRHPEANYTVYETPEGINYFNDGRTAWVKTGVTVSEIEHIEYLPIMDFRNQSIPLDKVTSFEVNKTIQRSLTKAIARHGLGLYIYAGEDLPEESDGKRDTPPAKKAVNPVLAQKKQVMSLLKELGIEVDEDTASATISKKTGVELSDENLPEIISRLKVLVAEKV